MHLRLMISFLTAPLFAFATDPGEGLAGRAGNADDVAQVRIPFDPARWELVWSEEFDREGEPDPETWSYETGYVRNREAQYYTSNRAENVRVEGGRLIIEAHLHTDPEAPHRITSGSLTTLGKREFLYGRIAVRAKVPTGRGTWPAIWTLGRTDPPTRWPAQGEIDIMEYVGFDPHRIHANVHTTAYNHRKGTGRGSAITIDQPWTRFHEFAVEWHEDRLEFFCDDVRYFVFRRESDDIAVWPFAHPHYLKLNLAIGGAWGGQKGIDESLFPHRFEIEHVRYYRLRH